MRSLLGISTLASVLVLAIGGCAAAVDPPDTLADEAATSVAADPGLGSIDDAYTYYGVTADLRKCPSPMCGGWFISRLNYTTTKCHDGTTAAACYTPSLDWSEAGLSVPTQERLLAAASSEKATAGVYAIVRGRFARTNHTTPYPEMGRFVITEGWTAESDALSNGLFVKIRDNGIRCFTTPCPSVTEITLNKAQSLNIAGIDWTPAGLTDLQISECVEAMATPVGVLVAGHHYTVQGDAGTAQGRTATAAYYRLSDLEP
jgi:hypothetical protein